MEEAKKTEKSSWYNKWYKFLFVIPIIMTILCLVYLGIFYSQNKDIMYRDVSLSGGTTITINQNFDYAPLESSLKQEFPDIVFRQLTDLRSGEQLALIIESSSPPETLKPAVESKLPFNLTSDNSSVEFTGATLSQGFYKQLMFALLISFVLMSIVIFIMFRSFVPSAAVIFAAFSDIVMPLAIIDYFGLKLSAAGIAAFLMLIGYSVDTDILLTTRALKKKEPALNQRIFGAFKTGILMTGTALAAVIPVLFLMGSLPDSFKQIFLILALGLFADIINTWLTNAGIIKWYCDKHRIE
jgi:preprotein translocase subunit SecF